MTSHSCLFHTESFWTVLILPCLSLAAPSFVLHPACLWVLKIFLGRGAQSGSQRQDPKGSESEP